MAKNKSKDTAATPDVGPAAKGASSLKMVALKPIRTADIFRPDEMADCGCGRRIAPGDTFTAPSEKMAASLESSDLAKRA